MDSNIGGLFVTVLLIVAFLVWLISERRKEEKSSTSSSSSQKMVESRQERMVQTEKEQKDKAVLDYILSSIQEGGIPDLDINWGNNGCPFSLQKSEHIIWGSYPVIYLEQKTKREIYGKSAGINLRVAKGVSFRVGKSKGTPVERDQIVNRGSGTLGVTTKHLYFNGNKRSFRIPLGKIVSVEKHPASTILTLDVKDDTQVKAVVISRDRASMQPEYFVLGNQEAQFLHELIRKIPSIDFGNNPKKIHYDTTSTAGEVGEEFHDFPEEISELEEQD